MTTRIVCQMIAVFMLVLLGGCRTPFAGKLARIDWSGTPHAGTISVSQPKMYRRASLINERQLDAHWLDEQLEHSKEVVFQPEIVRETEQIQSMALALGLRFDPVTALKNERIDELGELRHQMDVIALQRDLDQLKRDAELARGKLASQTEPLAPAPGGSGGGSPGTPTPIEADASIATLIGEVEKLSKRLTDRLDNKAEAIALAPSGSNPGDLLRDRISLRDQIKAARNAASLDDSHDMGGRALIRLNFQAMVVPPVAVSRVPGVVQMTILPPKICAREEESIYMGWLEHINGRLNRESDTGFAINQDILESAVADNFDIVEYHYSLLAAPADGGKSGKNERPVVKSAAAPVPTCSGLNLDPVRAATGCGKLMLAVPKFRGTSVQEGAYATLVAYAYWFDMHKDEVADQKVERAQRALIIPHAASVVRNCAPPIDGDGAAHDLYAAVQKAKIRVAAGDAIILAERSARRILRAKNIASTPSRQSDLIKVRAERARKFLATFIDGAYARCPREAIRRFEDMSPAAYVPSGFRLALRPTDETSIYEIGPREQVQHVSSVARVANSLSLALAVAGSAPGSPVGAKAAADYSRQAIGKAAVTERVPALVGYAASPVTFGWVIAPKAVFDPSGSIELEQTLRTMDLSVDLAVPAWWPSFEIDTVALWSPEPDAITRGKIDRPGNKPAPIKVKLDSNYADFQALTERLMFGGPQDIRQVLLDDTVLARQAVSACRRTSLYIKGANIWRATSVLIAGQRLDETAITVAPDMSGILVSVPELGSVVGETALPKLRFSVLTRYGNAEGSVDYLPKPVPGGCKPTEKAPAADAPAIASLQPVRFRAGARVEFTIEGDKLDQLDRVTINGQPGTIEHGKKGKRLRAIFEAAQTASLPVSRTIVMSFFKGDEKPVERLVEVASSKGD